ncbi:hypothetical protein CSH63_24025 [Micromonospora tulbaghiae]|uniref:Uncharacterized protein n=1 Tax=Micromonospora tulbaghiae TaxID=479978 RepID=A0A386WSU0_9ACTN|nr:hypothetical protein CSH63_24025 [Micromonospora tulbaghiae]
MRVSSVVRLSSVQVSDFPYPPRLTSRTRRPLGTRSNSGNEIQGCRFWRRRSSSVSTCGTLSYSSLILTARCDFSSRSDSVGRAPLVLTTRRCPRLRAAAASRRTNSNARGRSSAETVSAEGFFWSAAMISSSIVVWCREAIRKASHPLLAPFALL